ncbi:MAG TPA: hypothetical protein VGQ76_23780 [Thermoanaerobaculia bacterium]|jgi:hypothetical protein|nr:hypothetical protein [Thermoanaerobaculia bacterium]
MRTKYPRYTRQTRLRGSFLCLLAIAQVAAAADPQPQWRNIVVRFAIGTDGALHLTERIQVDMPLGIETLERRYWTDAHQQMTFDRLLLVFEDGDAIVTPFQAEPGKISWRIPSEEPRRSFVFIIESTVTDAVIPAWSIPRAELSKDHAGPLSDPKTRLRELLPLWREAAKNPRRRYLLDYQYETPPISDVDQTIQLQLYWPDGWTPVHEITGDTIGRKIDADIFNTARWRVTHLFDYVGDSTPAAIDIPRHAIRTASVVGFPIASLFLLLILVACEIVRRHIASRNLPDDRQLLASFTAEHPEVIDAHWKLKATRPRTEAFLRRMQRARKVAIVITPARHEDDDPMVSLRLLIPREQLTSYERVAIDALIPTGWETSSTDVQRRFADEDLGFDPASLLEIELEAIAAAGLGPEKTPWFSRLTSFALFAGGIALLVLDLVRTGREPALLAVALIASSMVMGVFPALLVRRGMRHTPAAALWLLVPILLVTAVIGFVHLSAPVPIGIYASAGLSLVLFSTIHAHIATSAPRDAGDALRRRCEIARARKLEAPPRVVDEVDEGWGEAFVT